MPTHGPIFSEATPLPSLADVPLLWDTYGMLDNIRAHSRRVRDVSLLLASWLEPAGVSLHPLALQIGALLHDIAKTPCLDGSCHHDQRGADILSELGYPQLGALVAMHVNFPPDGPIDEAAVVYYADKRVRHDTIVSLDKRFDYIEQRYGRGRPERIERIAEGKRRAFAMQKRLFSLIENTRPTRSMTRYQRDRDVPSPHFADDYLPSKNS